MVRGEREQSWGDDDRPVAGTSVRWVVVVGALALIFGIAAALHPMGYSPDSASYIEIADNLASGAGITSRIMFVDSPAVIPSPVAWWPPGYPASVGLMAAFGVPLSAAAKLVSVLAFGIAVPLIWVVTRRVFGAVAGWVALPLALITTQMTQQAGSALSESLAASMVMFAMWGVVMYAGSKVRSPGVLIAVGIALAAASLTHYKALPMIPIFALGVFALRHDELDLGQRAKNVAITALAAGLPVVAWLVRNLVATGSITGAGRGVQLESVVDNALTAVRSLATTALFTIRRGLVVPELLNWRLPHVAILVIIVSLVSVVALARRNLGSRAVWRRLGAVRLKRVQVFLFIVGPAYVVVMILARSFLSTNTDPLRPRLLGLSFPLLVVATSGAASILIPSSRRFVRIVALTSGAVILAVATLIVIPSSVRGLEEDHFEFPLTFPYFPEVGSVLPGDALVIGNQLDEFPMATDLPVVTFSDYEYTQSEFACESIAAIATGISRPVFLLLHGENRALSPEAIPEYGPAIETIIADPGALGLSIFYESVEATVYSFDDGVPKFCARLEARTSLSSGG